MKMKFLSLVLASGLFFASCSSTRYETSSTNDAYAAPVIVSSSFSAQYPNATNVVWSPYDVAVAPVDWELNGWTPLTDDDYMVVYNLDQDKYYAFYDETGTWVGTAYAVTDYSLMPSDINSMLKNRYPGYSIESVQREMWKDHEAYQVKMKGENDQKVKLLIDMNGNILKEKNKD